MFRTGNVPRSETAEFVRPGNVPHTTVFCSIESEDLNKLFNFLLENYEHVVFTRDIEINNKNDLLKEKFTH